MSFEKRSDCAAEVNRWRGAGAAMRPVLESLEERLLLDAAQVITQPVSTTATEGWKALFTVEVSGTEPIDYQWQEDDGGGWANIAWASGTALPTGVIDFWTPVTAMADDGTQFQCIVTNGEGGETSSAATTNRQASMFEQPGVAVQASSEEGPSSRVIASCERNRSR